MKSATARRMLCWFALTLAGGCCSSVPDETHAVVSEPAEQQAADCPPEERMEPGPAAYPEEDGKSKTARSAQAAVPGSDPNVKQALEKTESGAEKKTGVKLLPVGVLVPPEPAHLLPVEPTPVVPPALPGLMPKLLAPGLADQPVPKDAQPERLKIPADLPGARVPPLVLPAPDNPAKKKEREEAIRRQFPDLAPLEAEPLPLPGPCGSALTLVELQKLALSNNPIVSQAAFRVESARGTAVQAGLWPNPVVGFEGDRMNSGGTAGQLGFFITQVIKTAGKPELARASALIDVLNAELAQRRAEADVLARVRCGYFSVLVARENLKVSRALAEFADEVYRTQVELLRAAQSPAYESLQLRVLSTQAHAGLVQARNRYATAWKQLAANIGMPAMPPTEVAGNADMLPPKYDYRAVLERVLKSHTDVAAAVNAVQKAQIDLKLAKRSPIPDVNLYVAVQGDQTTVPFSTSANVQVGVPIPVWDRNQGAIQAADAALMRAEQESARVRNDLTGRVAEAFERYDNNRRILDYYRTGILPDQVRAYRALYLRHNSEPEQVNLQDVVNAQQILAQSVTTYVGTLNALWLAVVDVSNLLQADDLFADTQDEIKPMK